MKQIVCSKCRGPLLGQKEEESEVVAIPCGHIFHKTCFTEACIDDSDSASESNQSKGKRKHKIEVVCPKRQCVKSFKWNKNTKRAPRLVNLFLEKIDNPDYFRLLSDYKELESENGKLKKDVCHLVTEAGNLQTENNELSKRMITAEIKSALLTNGDLLEEKFGEVKWRDITPTFQKELLGKVQVGGRPFLNLDEIVRINSKALMRIIKAGEKDETLLPKIIEDYFDGKKQSNGKVSWDDLDNSVREYLKSKLNETNEAKSLELTQVPLSSNTLVHLIADKSEGNPFYLGKIVAGYVGEMVYGSSSLMNDLCKVALLKCINGEVIGCLDTHFLNPKALERLVQVGMLKKNESEFGAPYEFSHDTVRHCIIGIILSKLMEQANVSRMNAFKLFYEGYTNPMGTYFADYMSEVEQSYLKNFTLVSHKTLANLLMTLCVMKLPSLKQLIRVLNHQKIDIGTFSRKIPLSKNVNLTLLHAAPNLRGDLERVKCLLDEFKFSKKLTNPRFKDLMHACVENTKECSEEQVEQRKEIIKELLKFNKDLVKCAPPNISLYVHEGLVKFVVELGADSWFTLIAKSE